ncbi:MAG TPA: hypothetical protein P5318_01180 [Candidatus Hydrogenedentes bacterium]|nr:hypothetical protein [Candidatus Hydrogenedentota bacterium]HRT18714.1 hypothetical protein [Candidatus Hydrogenedentota bacterium]HRT63734.1 hypothetical protein [Candidatus Hydrogenedentota bacterium]
MKRHRMLVLALAMAVAMGLVAGAYAAEGPACPAAKAEKANKDAKAAKAAPADKSAKPKVEVKCEVKGKLDSKMVTNKKTGKEAKVFQLTVAEAKNADGKALEALKGKTLGVAGKKGLKLGDYAGKDVTIAGTLVNNKRLVPDTIK